MDLVPTGRWRAAIFSTTLAALLLTGASAGVDGQRKPVPRQGASPKTAVSPTPVPGWAEADRLVSEQKFAQALEVVSARRAAAQKSGDEADWARGLIRETQLETALHGYETAVRHLRAQPWPKGLRHRAALELFYAQSLANYAQMYSWEIRQRERVESTGEVDLKAWTAEQIGDEASRAYLRLWAEREALGALGVRELSEFIQPNDYPRGIRDTMRDALSYFFVQHLADTSGWSPAESNEVFRLDLAALLSDSGGGARPEDATAHPLARLSAVLADLEAWHRSRGEREGSLEARLERSRRLAAGFTEEADRARIEADLAGRLPAFHDVPWFSMGKAELALLVERPGGDGDLVKARAIAEEGRRAYPDSIGGRRCRTIVQAIESPSYQLETMASDGPDRRSVRVRHKNVARLRFRTFALDFAARLARAKNENELLPDSSDAARIADSAKPFAEWTVELPATPDYRLHSTFVVPRVGGPGLYLITASGENGPLVAASFFQSDLVLVSRTLSGLPLEVQTVSGASGKPLADTDVTLWRGSWNPQKIEKTAAVRTDASGFAHIAAPDDKQWYSRFLVARRGPHFALARNIWFSGTAPAPPEAASLLFTDRSVYRPQQKVLWKVVAYRGDRTKGRLAVFPQTPVTVSLVDANNQKVESATVTTNDFGSAAGEFRIPAGRVLGAWRLESSLPGGMARVRVEEYKRPSFEVTLLESREPMRLNRPATIRGEARYYFGLPVASGEVRWRVTRTPQYWWWSFFWWRPPSNPQTVAAGRSALQPDGSFTIAFTPAADERAATKDVTWRYQVDADAVDEGGETHSAGRSFRLGLVSVEARLDAPPGFLRESEPARLAILRTDLDGAPRPGRGTWTIHRLEQPAETRLPADEPPAARGEKRTASRTPGDDLRARWETDFSPQEVMRRWKEGPEVARGTSTHGVAGKAELPVPPLPAGAYRLRYKTLDEFGAAFEFPADFFVAGPRTPVALPVALLVENDTVRVGGTARFLAASGLPDQPLLFEKYRAGRLVTRRELASGRAPAVLDLPVEEADRGGFAVRLVTVRDHQLVSLGAAVSVPWDDKELQIAFQTFRDRLKPGARETWTVRVTEGASGGPKGRAAAAELLAYMYDRSLDVFAPHVPASIASLYPNGTTTDALQAALGEASFFRLRGDFPSVSGVALPHADALIFPSGYPIGGPGRRGMMVFEGGVAGGIMAQRAEAPAPAALAKAAPEDKVSVAKAVATRADAAEAAAPAELRSNFAETAFWEPALRTGPDGSASLEFTVPDSVTAWSVWVHAFTKNFRGGATRQDARSVKDLMVRPYVPRFFRAGDRADLEVVVDNASEREMSGTVELDVVDTETNASVREAFGLTKESARRPFTAAAGRGTHATFPLTAPARPGLYAIRATAASGDASDGELRPVPVLPGRMTLSQSRFVALHGNDRRTMTFADLAKNDDPTRVDEQLVVTLDAQLFDSVLQALPYLVQYPYECTEQTLNRFVSTGIVSSVFRDNPQIAKMAAELARRSTRLAPWDAADPNRRMALEETPWLETSRGGADPGAPLIRVLDPKIAQSTRESAIEKLRKAQTPEGGFPWWPGGPPSAYMTVYILHGFANALEFGVDVPKDMIQRAWTYARGQVWSDLHRCMTTEGLCPLVTFVNYTLSSYPDPSWYQSAFSESDRRELLAYSFARWKLHSPYLKAQLALTLSRMGRGDDAKLVWASVMDSSKTDRDLGTFWAPEDRSWLWYNDTIETQALALRTLMEVEPADARRHGLVQWLFLNKKLNQWKSTRATAEVIASVVRYLKAEGALGIREEASVSVGGRRTAFVFEPDQYTGARNQVVVPGEKIDPARDSTVVVEKPTKGMAFASATWTFSTEKLPAEDRGDFFAVSRRYFRREASPSGFVLKPLGELPSVALGDEIEVQISLTSKHEAEYVHLRDPRPAGSEPVRQTSGYRWDLGLGRYEEVRDSGQNFFFERLPAGQYTLKYRIRASMAGTFKIAPATVQSMYAPEFHAYSAGNVVEIRSEGGRR